MTEAIYFTLFALLCSLTLLILTVTSVVITKRKTIKSVKIDAKIGCCEIEFDDSDDK